MPDGPPPLATHQNYFDNIHQLAELEYILARRHLLHQPLNHQEQRNERQERRAIYNRIRIGIQTVHGDVTMKQVQRFLYTTAVELNGFNQLRIQYKSANLITRTIQNFRLRMNNDNNNQIANGIAQLVQAMQQQLNLGHPPAPVREVNLIKIDSFDGTSDPITWMESFERAATANGLTDARKLLVAPAYLTGTATAWLQGRQANNNTNPATWVHNNGDNPGAINLTFRQPFINHFRNPGRIAMWQQELDNCKQIAGQTVDQYVTKLRELMKRVDPDNAATEYTKVSNFMRGLDQRYKFHVRATNPQALERAIETAKAFEMSYNELAQQPIGIVQAPADKNVLALLGEVQTQLQALQMAQTMPPANRQFQNNQNRQPRSNQDNRACYNCGKVGHIARECRSRGNNNNNQNNNQNGNNRNMGQNWRGNQNNNWNRNNNGNQNGNDGYRGNNNNNNNNNNRNNNDNCNRQQYLNDETFQQEVKNAVKEVLNLKD